MLVVLGDLHLRADYPWFVESAEHFLKWFDDWDLNNQDNEIMLLGDLVERPVNGGIVVDFLERLYLYSDFKRMHIIVGNHDFKRIDKKYQLAYDFLKRKSSVSIYEKKVDVNIQRINCLLLPFITPTIDIPVPNKYYSDLYKKRGFVSDVVFGHIQDENFPGDGVKNIDKLAKYICLGHIHSRVHSNYIGSLYPNNYSQNGQRYFRTYEKLNNSIIEEEHPLPIFLDFKIINYGDEVIKDKALTSVYVIHGGPARNLMDSKYEGLHIKQYYKATTRENKIKAKLVQRNTQEYFKDFIKHSDTTFNRNTIKICKEALEI